MVSSNATFICKNTELLLQLSLLQVAWMCTHDIYDGLSKAIVFCTQLQSYAVATTCYNVSGLLEWL